MILLVIFDYKLFTATTFNISQFNKSQPNCRYLDYILLTVRENPERVTSSNLASRNMNTVQVDNPDPSHE